MKRIKKEADPSEKPKMKSTDPSERKAPIVYFRKFVCSKVECKGLQVRGSLLLFGAHREAVNGLK